MKNIFRWGILPLLLLAFSVQVFGQTSTIWVPVRVNILLKDSNDNTGINIDRGILNKSFAYANRKFKGANIQFFIHSINEIRNTALYLKSYGIDFQKENITEKELTTSRDSPNTLNMYFVANHNAEESGSSQVPYNDKISASHIFIKSNSNNEGLWNTITHELGHSFYLLHTYETNANFLLSYQNPLNFQCERQYDGICDTPIDPYKKRSNNLADIIRTVLTYGKFENYTPDLSNLMSYYYTQMDLTKLKASQKIQKKWLDFYNADLFSFSLGQLSRIRKYAERRRDWSNSNFNYTPTTQALPTITSINLNNGITIQWTHNSTNETGYFIERATNLSPTNFVCVGGVAPNTTTFTDNPSLKGISTIHYRIIPSNAKGTGAYSTVMSINVANNIKFGQTIPLSSISNQEKAPASSSAIIAVCKNTSFDVEFSAEGAYNANNLFRVQLSDQNGSFGSNPLVIGSGTDSPISATIPNQSFPAGNYKIRIVSTSPIATSAASADTYTIYPPLSPPTLAASPTTVPYGYSSILSATGCSGTVHWSFNKSGSVQIVTPVQNTTYTAYCQTTCKSDDASIALTVSTPNTENITAMEYFFDTDPGFGSGTSVSVTPSPMIETNIPVNVSTLVQGVHVLNIRVKTASNKWSATHTQTVLVYGTGSSNAITKFEYFYDTDPGFNQGTAINVSPDSSIFLEADFSTNGLSQGLHNLYVRAKDGANRWSATEHTPVMVLGTGNGSGVLSSLEYFIDTDPGIGNATSVSLAPQTDATKSFNVNLSAVSMGVHVLYVRVKDDFNRWSTIQSQVFVKIPNTLTKQIVQAEYFIDTDPGQGIATPISFSPNPAQEIFGSIAITANSLTKGTHTIYVRVKDSGNLWSAIASTVFEVESTPCPPVTNISTATPAGTTQAMERIFSTSKVETGINANYRAGNSVLLSPGFETKSNVSFKITIVGCVND